MGTKYYHAENSTRVFNVNGREVLFQPYNYFGGTWRGIYATEDEQVQAGLDHMAAASDKTITVISQADFEAKRQQLPSHLKETYNPVDKNVVSVKAALTPTKSGKPAQIEDDPEAKQEVRNPEEPKAEGLPITEASEALNVGPIAAAVEKPQAPKPKPQRSPKPQ